ncbi:MAG TPA: acetate uptake transporter [Gaiellaceae bacterium]|jgi:succinate-acetate transporter protein|nr:acetate uptake transporter [Gaiellaceae bacterium]
MAVLAEERRAATLVELSPAADPAPLGLAAFALTTFMLSGHNATFIPDVLWVGLALFYGGTIQLLAGMWEFRNRNVFGSTAFSTYGGFWLALGVFVVLAETTKLGTALKGPDLDNGLAWFLLSFAIFNTYMMLWSLRVNVAVFAVFLTLEITEILLTIGFFRLAHGGTPWILHAGGWAGIVTAATAWYASAAGVVNGMSPRPVLPVGRPMWDRLPLFSQLGSPMPRRTEA